LDISLAYYLKKRISYGNIHKVKGKNAVILTIAAKNGIKKVINLINGKIRTKNKLSQIINNILKHENYQKFSKTINFEINTSNDLANP
jgi:hypothetical protein